MQETELPGATTAFSGGGVGGPWRLGSEWPRLAGDGVTPRR